jgi:hypothetical protein
VLVEALTKAGRLTLAEHPHEHVRQKVEAATLALGRIQRCKAALASGIKTLEATMLIDALAMAASIGYAHPLVEEAKRVLASVQQLTERANRALQLMDAVEMQASLRDCEAIGLTVPALADIRRMLALSRPEYLRRELAAVLALAAGGSAASAGTVASLHRATAESPRAPTGLELRVIQCTLQLKDLFFADAPSDADEAGLLASVAGAGPTSAAPGGGPSFLAHPAAAPAVATLLAQKHADDNVRGAAVRTSLPAHMQHFGWALCPPPPAAATTAVFKPSGGGAGSTGAVGSVVPPSHSRLRRQFDATRSAKLKPPHIFSKKYSVADTPDTGLMRWQHEPLHTSLTLMADAELRRLAVKTFRDVLAFMGDRPLARPHALASELLELCLAHADLRDEVLLQLIKQLNGNPSIASMERGWVLLHLALCTFPPSEDLENQVELFLRDRGALPCVWALHLTLYRNGPGIAGAPSAAEVASALERARAPALPVLNLDGTVDGLISSPGAPASRAAATTPRDDTVLDSYAVSSRDHEGGSGGGGSGGGVDAYTSAVNGLLAAAGSPVAGKAPLPPPRPAPRAPGATPLGMSPAGPARPGGAPPPATPMAASQPIVLSAAPGSGGGSGAGGVSLTGYADGGALAAQLDRHIATISQALDADTATRSGAAAGGSRGTPARAPLASSISASARPGAARF